MGDYYRNTKACIDEYSRICDKAMSIEDLTDEEEEILFNHCVYLAHALIKDCGANTSARKEMGKMADIINDIIM